jgi:uncharacterized protein YdaU (DUF1376 family)
MPSLPEAWRQWIPIDVDDFLGSHDLHQMTSDAFKGYFLLILQQWKSENGYLPLDEVVLRKKAWLSSAQWNAAKEEILEKFDQNEEGYSNPRCRAELEKVQAKHQAKLDNVAKTNQIRKEKGLANAERTQGHAPHSYSPSSYLSSSRSRSLSELNTQGLDVAKPERPESLSGSAVDQSEPNLTPRIVSFDTGPCLLETDDIDSAHSVDTILSVIAVEEDQSVGASTSFDPRQRHLEAANSANQSKTESATSSQADWPEDVDFDDALEELIAAHPRPTSGHRTNAVIITQLERIQKLNGGTLIEAYKFLFGRMVAYKAATSTWPEDRKPSITGIVKFVSGREYLQDEAIWGVRSDGNSGSGNKGVGDYEGSEGAIRRAREARGAADGDVRLVPLLGTEALKRKQQDARESFAGLRRGLAYSGPR